MSLNEFLYISNNFTKEDILTIIWVYMKPYLCLPFSVQNLFFHEEIEKICEVSITHFSYKIPKYSHKLFSKY